MILYGDIGTHALRVYVAGSDTGGDDINIAQVNGITVNVGTGAASTGTLRVATATDSTIGTVTTVTTVTTLTGTTTLTPGTGATNLGKAVDNAAGATDTGVPNLIIRDDALTTLTPVDGDYVPQRADSLGSTWVTQGTLISGEDQTNNVLKVEGQFTRASMTSATTTTHKSGSGLLHTITVNKAIAAATITMYDNTAASGTLIGTITFGAALLTDPPLLGIYDINFGTGFTVVTSAATDITFSYR